MSVWRRALTPIIISAAQFIVVLPLTSTPVRAECLANPGTETPRGQHWYYSLERATGRHCWYLRNVAGQTAASRVNPKAVLQSNPELAVRSAHAEYESSPVPDNANTIDQSTPVASSEPEQVDGGAASSTPPEDTATTTAPATADESRLVPPTDQVKDSPLSAKQPDADGGTALKTEQRSTSAPAVTLEHVIVFASAAALAIATAGVMFWLIRRREERRSQVRKVLAPHYDVDGSTPPWSEASVAERKQDAQGTAAAGSKRGRPVMATSVPERYEKMGVILRQLVDQGQRTDA